MYLAFLIGFVAMQRRRSAEDAHTMRRYLQEGDLISAEVQDIFQDGSLSLHTRSLKYGKVFDFNIKLSAFLTLTKTFSCRKGF